MKTEAPSGRDDIPEILRPADRLRGLTPYAAVAPSESIDLRLSGNEGAAPPAELLAGVHGADELMRRYPNVEALEREVAERHGVSPGRVLVTAGADDALQRACLATLDRSRELILPVPTFEMLERYANLAGGRIIEVAWSTGAYPTDAVMREIRPTTAVIAVVTPNNPTGAVANAEDLRRLSLAAPGALLLVDLAYTEFADVDLTSTALSLPNALVIRTLSKAWGLAGLRVGYAIGAPQVIRWLRCAGNPYPVSGLSAQLAATWLKVGSEDRRAWIDRVRTERSSLAELLRELGANPLPSEANFVLAEFQDAARVGAGLARRGVGVRAFPAHPLLTNHLRITCPGDPSAFARLTDALRQIMTDQEES